MIFNKAGLWRHAALVAVAGALVSASSAGRADLIKGLSFRAGFLAPSKTTARRIVDAGAPSLGLQYELPWVPRLLNGEHWTSSISADFAYTERRAGGSRNGGIYRAVPIMVNQVFTFEEQNGNTPYAGFCLGVALTGGNRNNGEGFTKVPTVGSFGGGVILGMNWGTKAYGELRYELYDKHSSTFTAEGARLVFGYRL